VRVCFLRAGPGPVEHAEALRGAGAEVVVAERAPAGTAFDVVVACGWRCAGEAFRADAARRAFLVTRLEHRALAAERPERLAAVVALDLPFELLVTSAWLDEALAEQHPHARRRRVPLGRPEVRSEAGAPGSGLRVLGAPPEVLGRCRAPVEAAGADGFDVVVALDTLLVENPGALEAPVSPLSPILDGFAAGAPCVAVPTEGRDEVVAHRVNGLVVDPDDVAGAAAALDLLATRPDLLEELRAGARQTAAAWPSWADAGAGLLAVLEELLAAPAEYDAAWPAALMADATAEAAKLSAQESARSDAMHAWARELEARAGGRAAAGGGASQVDRLRARLRGRS
jgi:glycosyltransferase involved in cell wall biosynthesis